MLVRLLIAVVLLALVGGGLVGFNLYRDQMIAQFFEDMPVQPLPVSVAEVEPIDWQPTIQTIGTANASQGVDLTVEAAGIVEEIGFEPNASVEQGEVLVQLDDGIQRADVEAARTQLELDRVTLERARQLRERGVGTDVSLDEARAAAQASQAQLERSVALLEQRQVRAPFDGTIGLPRIERGQYVQPGTVVATLQDIDAMRVDFSLSERQLLDVSIGQALQVRVEGADRVFEGEIVGIDPRVDPASRMASVRGLIGEAEGRLTPGQFVRLEIVLPQEQDVIALPQTSVISSLYGDYVYAVRPRDGAAAGAQADGAETTGDETTGDGATGGGAAGNDAAGDDAAGDDAAGDEAGGDRSAADPANGGEREDGGAGAEAGAASAGGREGPQLEVRQVFVQPGRRSGGLIEVRGGIGAGDLVVTAGQNRLSNGAPVVISEEAAEARPAGDEPAAPAGDGEDAAR